MKQKALGDYTKTISDFSLFPSKVKEGRVDHYWYHEDTQSFFDDLDHYKMIKAMYRLSCGVCDKMEDHPDDASRMRAEFRSIEQLKAHLFHKHKLMCNLCLEGRKLCTRSQLTQHTNMVTMKWMEPKVKEEVSWGILGLNFAEHHFMGDNEPYSHMSTEHCICHVCQRIIFNVRMRIAWQKVYCLPF